MILFGDGHFVIIVIIYRTLLDILYGLLEVKRRQDRLVQKSSSQQIQLYFSPCELLLPTLCWLICHFYLAVKALVGDLNSFVSCHTII